MAARRKRFNELDPLSSPASGDLVAVYDIDKNVTKNRAQQLWPTIKVTHAIADALLLGEYCRLHGQ